VARRARAKPAETVTTGHLVRRVSWAGLRAGDPVSVAGTGIRSASWSFVAHVTNAVTGAEWVEVVGGGPGDRKLRSFGPERVFPPGAGRTRAGGPASLADAPQLPF
jgi:hypothetical protein